MYFTLASQHPIKAISLSVHKEAELLEFGTGYEPRPGAPLSDREEDCPRALAEGLTNKEIGEKARY